MDKLFVELIEAVSSAVFIAKDEKLSFVKISIRKLETLQFLLLIIWETKSLDDKKYIALSLLLEEIGRMLGGWNGQLIKQTPLPSKGE